MRSSYSSYLETLAQRNELPLSTDQAEQLEHYLELLLLWNKKVNLTGATSTETILNEHLPDSFCMAKAVPPDTSVVDVGSGAGLPAIPFAILRPDSTILLVEPRAKRTAFLLEVCRQIGLSQVTVLRGRLEEIPPKHHVFFSSKATFDPQTWLNLSLPLCDADSRVLAFLGRETNPELLIPPPLTTYHYLNGRNFPRCIAVFAHPASAPNMTSEILKV